MLSNDAKKTIKDIVKENSHTARWGLYIMVILMWANTCDIEKKQSEIETKLDRIEYKLNEIKERTQHEDN